MNPASVMKLVTTFAALELLGRDYRWKTDAYLDGPLDDGVLHGDLVLKGGGDPKITIEQWQAFMAMLRDNGPRRDRRRPRARPHVLRAAAARSGAFDGEPLKPYNVGPDALLVNFKSVRFRVRARTPTARRRRARRAAAAAGRARRAAGARRRADCGDWRTRASARVHRQRGAARRRAFAGRYPRACGERDWWVSLLDHPTLRARHVRDVLRARPAGGSAARCGKARAPRGAAPFATLESPPLYDIVRDINKLSNNVMARQIFLTLATDAAPPPATPAKARRSRRSAGSAQRKLAMPELVIENGSGLSRRERISAGGLARLLAAADASPVREEFASSLAVAAMDGTVQRRFQNGTRRRAGAAEDRLARRRARARRLRHRRTTAGAGSSSRSSTTRTPRARTPRARLPGAMGVPERRRGYDPCARTRDARWASWISSSSKRSPRRSTAGEFDDLPGAGQAARARRRPRSCPRTCASRIAS